MNENNMTPHLRRTWAEVDLSAAEYNFKQLKKIAGDRLALAVIKADAYGHGAVRLAELYSELGADFLAVSNLDEALELRRANITLPILVLGFVAPEAAPLAADADVAIAIYSLPLARAISDALVASNKTVKAHLKFDTGMGRIGFIPEKDGENALPDALLAASLPMLEIDGAFTHFAVADGGTDASDEEYTREQARRFAYAMDYLAERGICPRLKHVSNSAATLDYPELSLDMVRLGISLYGLYPSAAVKSAFMPKPVMTLKSVISHVKTIPRGASVSYGRRFIAERDTRVATVPVGYADGFFRCSWRSDVKLTVRGRAVPILGSVCMDQLMLDITDIPEAQLLDEVLIFGDGAHESADSVASKNGTIGYEVVCAIARRVPRIYKRDGKMLDCLDYLL